MALIKLNLQAEGYLLNGEAISGYPDQPHLSDEERTRIAHWARIFAPQYLSPAQQMLLARPGAMYIR